MDQLATNQSALATVMGDEPDASAYRLIKSTAHLRCSATKQHPRNSNIDGMGRSTTDCPEQPVARAIRMISATLMLSLNRAWKRPLIVPFFAAASIRVGVTVMVGCVKFGLVGRIRIVGTAQYCI